MDPHPSLSRGRRKRVRIRGTQKTIGGPRGGVNGGEIDIGELSEGIDGEERENGGEGGYERHNKAIGYGSDSGCWGGWNCSSGGGVGLVAVVSG